jgi:hypothetical protein
VYADRLSIHRQGSQSIGRLWLTVAINTTVCDAMLPGNLTNHESKELLDLSSFKHATTLLYSLQTPCIEASLLHKILVREVAAVIIAARSYEMSISPFWP